MLHGQTTFHHVISQMDVPPDLSQQCLDLAPFCAATLTHLRANPGDYSTLPTSSIVADLAIALPTMIPFPAAHYGLPIGQLVAPNIDIPKLKSQN
jgi:hypothetical protein